MPRPLYERKPRLNLPKYKSEEVPHPADFEPGEGSAKTIPNQSGPTGPKLPKGTKPAPVALPREGKATKPKAKTSKVEKPTKAPSIANKTPVNSLLASLMPKKNKKGKK